MNSHGFSSSPFLPLVCFIWAIFVKIQLSSSNMYESCKIQFQCGSITAGYPFWGGLWWDGCGHPDLFLNCEGEGHLATMMINEVNYRVLDIKWKDQTLRIARMDYLEGICPPAFPPFSYNTTVNSELFDYSDGYQNVTFMYDCPSNNNQAPPLPSIPCPPIIKAIQHHKNLYIQEGNHGPGNCITSVFFPVPKNLPLLQPRIDYSLLRKVLDEGFELKWKLRGISCEECNNSKGSCGWDRSSKKTICFCPNQPNDQFGSTNACPGEGKLSLGAVVVIVVGSAVAGIVVVVLLLLIIRKIRKIAAQTKTRDLQTAPTCNGTTNTTTTSLSQSNDQDVEALVKTYGSLAPKRYNYSDIKKMTNSFAVKLGQGGYGIVYRGKLYDGRIVAVKVLGKPKGNGEEFINEVACISRTSHVNIVGLLGFCYEGNRRALIYEFMPNGSLDKFINQGSLNTNLHLEWETLYQIVIGVARGLEYLHRGCNIRIVHFDIKPHNVLLDEDFCPKISDFGLAKICKKKESIISMLDARGTIGYTAPEVFCRNFGGVSHKSDVYGFGMMVLEMVGVRQRTAGDHESNASEIYFPDWIYKQIEGSNDLTIERIVNEEEEAIARKMILVSLWCIQTNPSDRPSMSKVVEMMEGSVQSLQVPPKPFLQHSSPRSFQLYSSTTSASLSRISS